MMNTDKTWIKQADKQLADLMETLEKMAACEASQGDGWYGTDHLSNIRSALNKLYEAKDIMEIL